MGQDKNRIRRDKKIWKEKQKESFNVPCCSAIKNQPLKKEISNKYYMCNKSHKLYSTKYYMCNKSHKLYSTK